MARSWTTRREFLQTTGAAGAAFLLSRKLAVAADGPSDSLVVRTRRDIYSLDPAGPEIAAFRRGVAAMKARPSEDSTSWSFQAAIHGTYAEPPHATWNQCQHGSFFFLSWHRMYLHFFERILRKASEDPSFALPYWNYGVPSQRAIPLVLREPQGAANPLFVAERNAGVNEGFLVPDSATRHAQSFLFTNFSSPSGSNMSFGGQTTSGPVHFDVPHGQLERQPHDQIHVLIGGSTGWMADPNTAAQDPVFWLHHSNIDRLWKRWLDQGGGRSNPLDNASWATSKFTFFDENGSQAVLTGADIVDTEGQLGYRYDDDPPPTVPTPVIPLVHAAPGSPAAPHRLAAGPEPRIELSDKPTRVRVSLPEPARVEINRVAAAVETKVALVLSVEGIEFDKIPGVVYEVYANLPEGALPDSQGPHYVGNLAFFGLGGHGGAHAAHAPQAPEGRSHRFAFTNVVRSLKQKGAWNDESLQVTFVERGLEPPPGKAPLARPGVKCTVRQIAVIRE